ncbi:MAG TPA: hypothetical protein VGE66_08105 [Chitinophagaceae bacterium]
MTSTLLFIDGHPIAYVIEPDGERFLLYPFHEVHPDVAPPSLTARREDNQWIIEGCPWQDLHDQVVEDLENYIKQRITA